MYVEFIHVANKQSDPAVYADLVKKAAATGRMLILECWDVECAKAIYRSSICSVLRADVK